MLSGIEQWVAQCAPQISSVTMMAIVRVESGGNPWAINVNGMRGLPRQPRTASEAITWANWLVARGHSIDMGLTQVNSGNLKRLGLRVDQMFDPCTNLATGARILSDFYGGAAQRFGEGQVALLAALSAYNTGNHQNGLRNGYVAKVASAAQAPWLPLTAALIPGFSDSPTIEGNDRLLKPSDAGTPKSPQIHWVKRLR